jgi:hypothetical protein
MQSVDFLEEAEKWVGLIDEDLKSKSRVYTWYYYDENNVDEEFAVPTAEPWEYTFKFVIKDNKVPVYERIWDGYGYPKLIRERVDLTNKWVKSYTREGKVHTFEKVSYFEEKGDRLSSEMYVLKAMINDKSDVLMNIIRGGGVHPIYGLVKGICEVCSPSSGEYYNSSNYHYKLNKYDKKSNEGNTVYDCRMEVVNKDVEEGWKKQLKKEGKDVPEETEKRRRNRFEGNK